MLRTSYSVSVAWANSVISPALIPAGLNMWDRDWPDATTPESMSNASQSNPNRSIGVTGTVGSLFAARRDSAVSPQLIARITAAHTKM
jgi:hypothetical protein